MGHFRILIAAACMLATPPLAARGAAPPSAPADVSQEPSLPLRAYVPTTISPEAAQIYRAYRAFILAPKPVPKGNADFETLYRSSEARLIPAADAAVKQFGSAVIQRSINGVPVYEVRPRGWRDDGTVILTVHGGGFVGGSAHSSLGGAARLADMTGKRVVSIDYLVAPGGNWRTITDQVIAVYKGIIAEGTPARRIGMTGGSAGGTIVAASVLKLRDQGLPMPAGLMLVSPMSDLTAGGDTRTTLADADPALNAAQVRPGLDAYAAPADQKNPYASPVYGDFSKGYPPVLIQGGTREWLLSDFVRLDRAIRDAGGTCDLEIFEGMPHGFPDLMPKTPEGREAAAEQVASWKLRLPGAAGAAHRD